MANFSTFHYILEHYTEEIEKKRMDYWVYLFVVVAIDGVDSVGTLVLILLPVRVYLPLALLL